MKKNFLLYLTSLLLLMSLFFGGCEKAKLDETIDNNGMIENEVIDQGMLAKLRDAVGEPSDGGVVNKLDSKLLDKLKGNSKIRKKSFDASSKITICFYYKSSNADHTMYPSSGGTIAGYQSLGRRVYANSSSGDGRIPLYLYYNSQNGGDLTFYPWVGSSCCGYSYLNYKIYVYPSSGSGRIPLYLYYSSSKHDLSFSPVWLGSSANSWVYQNYKVYVYRPNDFASLIDYGATAAGYGQSKTEFVGATDYQKWRHEHYWLKNYGGDAYGLGMKHFKDDAQAQYNSAQHSAESYPESDWIAYNEDWAEYDFWKIVNDGPDCANAGKIMTFTWPNPHMVYRHWNTFDGYCYKMDHSATKKVQMRYTFLNMWKRLKAFESVYDMTQQDIDEHAPNYHNFSTTLLGKYNVFTYQSFDSPVHVRSVIYASCDDSYFVQKNADVVYAVCFTPKTKVSTPDGYKNIEDLKKGDLVLSCDVKTGKTGYKPIGTIKKLTTYDKVTLNVKGEKITTTPVHPFWTGAFKKTDDKYPVNWVQAKDLSAGTKLVNSSLNTIELKSTPIKQKVAKGQTVYNIMVEDWHTYFVGKSKILVHNGDFCNSTIQGYKYIAKLLGLGGRPGSVRAEFSAIPGWLDLIPPFNAYLLPFSIATNLRDYDNGKISGGECVYKSATVIASHYVDQAGNALFPNHASQINFARDVYNRYESRIPPNQRLSATKPTELWTDYEYR